MQEGGKHRADLTTNMNAGKCTMESLKRFLLIRLATDRHTHPKRNGPRGSLFGPSARDGRRAEGQSLAGYLAASCGFTDSHLWSSESVDGNGDPSSSAPTQTTPVGLKPTTQSPRARDPGCSVTTTTRSHRKRPQTARTMTADQVNRHNDCSPLDIFIGVFGFSLAGARVRCSPLAHWAEETLHALFWSGAPI